MPHPIPETNNRRETLAHLRRAHNSLLRCIANADTPAPYVGLEPTLRQLIDDLQAIATAAYDGPPS